MKQFKVGDTWQSTMMIGWATITHTIISRTENTLVERQEWIAEDTGRPCSCEDKREIKVDNGVEYYVRYGKGIDEVRRYADEL